MRPIHVVVVVALLLAACGQKGELYLPDEADGDQAALTQPQPPAARREAA